MTCRARPVPSLGVVLACAATLLVLGAQPVLAAFTTTTANGGSDWATDTLDPPTGLTAGRPCTAVAAPAFRSSSAISGSTATLTVSRPAGVQAGDLLVAVAVSTDDSDPPTAPAGWTTVTVLTNAGENNAGGAFYRWTTAGEPASYVFGGFDTSDAGAVVVAAYSGADPSTPVEATASSNNGASTTATAPSVTAGTAPTRLVAGYVVGRVSSLGTPAGMTARVQQATTAPTDLAALYDEARSGTGATGTRTVAAGASVGSLGFSLLLRAAPVTDHTVTLDWTPTTDTYATGYELTRTGGGTVVTSISGGTTATYTDSSTVSGTAYSYSLRAAAGTWRSTAAGASVNAC